MEIYFLLFEFVDIVMTVTRLINVKKPCHFTTLSLSFQTAFHVSGAIPEGSKPLVRNRDLLYISSNTR